LADYREIWQDDAAQDCGGSGIVKIHLRSKLILPPLHPILCEIRIPVLTPLAFKTLHFDTERSIWTQKQTQQGSVMALCPPQV